MCHCSPAASTSKMSIHAGLGLIPSFRQWLCYILAFILTSISACRCMSSNLWWAAWQSRIIYAAFDDLFRHLCISRHWSLPLSWLNYGNAALAGLLEKLAQPSPVCHQRGSSVDRRSPSLRAYRKFMLSPVSTGFEHPSASSSNWRSLSTELITAVHLSTYDQLQCVAYLPSRRRGRLRLSTSSLLDVRPSRLVIVGDRSFAAAGPRLWNSLAVDDLRLATHSSIFSVDPRRGTPRTTPNST